METDGIPGFDRERVDLFASIWTYKQGWSDEMPKHLSPFTLDGIFPSGDPPKGFRYVAIVLDNGHEERCFF